MAQQNSAPDLLTTKRIGLIAAPNEADPNTARSIALQKLVDAAQKAGLSWNRFSSIKDFVRIIELDIEIDSLLIESDQLGNDDDIQHVQTLVSILDSLYSGLPVFILADKASFPGRWQQFMGCIDGVIYLYEDTADFIMGRVGNAVNRYQRELLPPFFAAMRNFALHYEYSWHTPGHTGGTAFLRSPAGKKFFDFFGEELFRSDLSISVGELGSLLDHSGPVGRAEAYAAKVFGADRTYFVTNGTSTSNRVVLGGVLADSDAVLVDRNCHKSIEHALTLTGAQPTYMVPTRNNYGIIGPIPLQTIRQKAGSANAKMMVITNSTYDGLCYNVERLERETAADVPVLHFDEAWYGYARFNPLYNGRFAMHDKPRQPDAPTVFATQSSHKLLAALSQASYIHLREGKHPLPHSQFNESFMMHASTSPQYAIIASNDVSAKMMAGKSGLRLTTESIQEAVSFRQTMAQTYRDKQSAGDWWFKAWQPQTLYRDGHEVPFEHMPQGELVHNPEHWKLRSNSNWHGFGDIDDDWCMLDPIKVTLVAPGIGQDGQYQGWGIPAAIVTKFLDTRSIVVEKTGDYIMLFLFSMGVTKGKWATLLAALHEFKQAYDQNQPLAHVFPDLVQENPAIYKSMGLKDLSNAMHQHIRGANFAGLLHQSFSELPKRAGSPRETYRQLVNGKAKLVTLSQAAGSIAATGIVPYPPGIPMLMPGEELGQSHEPFIGYLKALESFDQAFPGFDHDIHGVTVKNSAYHIWCLEKRNERGSDAQ